MVSKRGLITIAGIVWLCAGINIVRLGIGAYRHITIHFWLILLSLVIFLIFGQGFFKMTNKNTRRIKDFPEEHRHFWHFFNLKSYLIMAFFMTFGITLRVSGLAPEWFIAFFYTGLGIALSLAGILYFVNAARPFE